MRSPVSRFVPALTSSVAARLLALPVVFAASMLTGCNNAEKDQVSLLTTENEDLRKQLADRNAALDAADRERAAALARADAAEKGPKSGEVVVKEAPGSVTDVSFNGIEGVSATRVGNEIHISIEGDVLFDSGKTAIKTTSRKSLDKVASVIREKYPNALIRVAGFTDTDPIKKSNYKSNYHLGFDRAYSVREYLVGKGLDGKRISLSSFGPDVPLNSKAKSRRVEVIVVGT